MTKKNNLGQWLANARQFLRDTSEMPGIELQALLAHELRRPRAWIVAHPEYELSDRQSANLNRQLAKLTQGTPLAYLTGTQEFFGLDFQITPDVLIPRPETELLVELALKFCGRSPDCRNAIDVGTGSGCIAISLAKNAPGLHLVATDLSWSALAMATRNARAHDVLGQIDFIQADLISPIHGVFDLVCANLPYVPSGDLKHLEVARFEPEIALNGGGDGMAVIRNLLSSLPCILAPGGMALLEIEYRQGDASLKLAKRYFPAGQVHIIADLHGLDRILQIQNFSE